MVLYGLRCSVNLVIEYARVHNKHPLEPLEQSSDEFYKRTMDRLDWSVDAL